MRDRHALRARDDDNPRSLSERSESISFMGRKKFTGRNYRDNLIIDMPNQFYVYIMTNRNNTVLYTGVTADLKRRVFEHKAKLGSGFTKKYNISKLIYFEVFEDPENAIGREKQIKAGSRQKKIDLIDRMNPSWRDLYEEI